MIDFLYRFGGRFFVLVGYFADKLFENILQSHDAGSPAVFVQNDGNVQFLVLKLVEQDSQRFGFRDKVNLPQFLTELEIHRIFADLGQQVLSVNKADYVIYILFVNRDARMAAGCNSLQNLLQIGIDLGGDDVGAGSHNFVGRAAA